MPSKIDSNTLRALARASWVALCLLLIATYYVNHYMPHGPMYDTGDVVCENDGRGPCGEEYIEDTHQLNIPDWAKFVRRYWLLVAVPLFVGGAILNEKAKQSS
jgi:hypothetical protein